MGLETRVTARRNLLLEAGKLVTFRRSSGQQEGQSRLTFDGRPTRDLNADSRVVTELKGLSPLALAKSLANHSYWVAIATFAMAARS